MVPDGRKGRERGGDRKVINWDRWLSRSRSNCMTDSEFQPRINAHYPIMGLKVSRKATFRNDFEREKEGDASKAINLFRVMAAFSLMADDGTKSDDGANINKVSLKAFFQSRRQISESCSLMTV